MEAKILLLIVSGFVCLIGIAFFGYVYWKMCKDEDARQEAEKKLMEEEYERRRRDITRGRNGRML